RLLNFGLLNSFRAGNYTSGGELDSLLSNPYINSDLVFEWWSNPRIDLYGFGRALGFMLAGSVSDPPTIPAYSSSYTETETRRALTRIVDRCCNVDSKNAYQTIAEILIDLSELIVTNKPGDSTPIDCAC